MSTGAPTFGHVDTAEALPRARLLERLTGSEQLCVLHAEGGSGKTVLLSQWASDAGEPVLWLDLRSHLSSRAGFWLRVLTRLHADGWLDDATLARKVIAISESPASIDSVIRRLVHENITPRTLVIDGLPDEAATWRPVVDDLVTLLQHRPDMRCLVACSSVAVRDALLADPPPISWVELTTTDLALSPREAREIVERDASRIDADRREAILTSEAAQRVASLRFAIEHHDAPVLADSLALHPAIMERFADSGIREFAGVIALAPVIDADLARDLTGRADAAQVLDRLARQGAGGWIPHESGQALFRYRDGVRQAASADFHARHARLVFAAKRKIARWIAMRLRDYSTALLFALEGRDYDHASRLMLRAWPFNHEDKPRLRQLVKTLPVAQIHRRPLLALWYGLLLNEDPATQSRAAPFFVSAAAMGRARGRTLSPAERAVLRGFESLTWRLIGQPTRMADAARQCIALIESATADPEFDTSLAEIVGTVFNQACVSLYASGAIGEARDAFAALVALADRLAMRHRRNLGLAGMAFVDAATGNVANAARTLDRIREDDWPEPWLAGYAGSLGRLGRAWIALSSDSPERVLAELDVLDPHVDTIEHWDLIAVARALAESRLGHARSAAHTFTRTVRSRLTRTSLPIVRDRVSGADAVLRILNGREPSSASENAGRTHRSIVLAMQAISAGANDDSATASTLLRKAEAAALAPQQELIAVVAGALCASRLSWDDELGHFASRIVDLAIDPGIRWPVILLPEADRTRLIDALGADEPATTMRTLFEAIRPVATEATWQSLARPALTPRESAVLCALFTHESRTELADALFVSVNTVKSQLRSLYAKLGVSTREQALARAVALGIAGDSDGDDAP